MTYASWSTLGQGGNPHLASNSNWRFILERLASRLVIVSMSDATNAEVIRQIESSLNDTGIAPQHILLIGKRGTGKSHALDICVRNHTNHSLDDWYIRPILKVNSPINASIKRVGQLMLDALCAEVVAHDTNAQITRRLKLLLKSTKTTMLILDEIEHLVESRSGLLCLEWVYALADDLGLSTVLSGTPHCLFAFRITRLL